MSRLAYHLRRRSIAEWEPIFEVKILDPDGFDRSDPDFYSRRYTYEEFAAALPLCTQMSTKGKSIYRTEALDG